MTTATSELDHERSYLEAAYQRVVQLRAAALGLAIGAAGEGELLDPESLFERDAAVGAGRRRLASLAVPRERMAVGRLDMCDRERLYIGRLAVADATGDPLIVDWRAPIAEAFYRATPRVPMGIVRRRHFRWRHEDLVGLDDEVFDTEAAARDRLDLTGEGALLAALTAPRTGRMTDVVATIQAEQDRVIRRPRAGILVVQGGPGTGKTAVALHRAAYLLFADRATFRHQSILFVGPNPRFLRYVEEVVPSLGEDQVVLASLRELGPDVEHRRGEPAEVAALKGDRRMVAVLAKAVRDRERAVRDDTAITCGRFVLSVAVAEVQSIIRRAHATKGTHNARRAPVERALLQALEKHYAEALQSELRVGRVGELGTQPLLDVVDRPALARLADAIWPILTPERVLGALLASPARLRRAGRDLLSDDDVELLVRPRDGTWSDAEVPLLDELAVLLGPIPERRTKHVVKVDPIVERTIEEHVPDCPTCGTGLTYQHGSSPEEDRLACIGGCEARFRSRTLLGEGQAQWVHALWEEMAEQFAVVDDERRRPADQRYGHVVIDEAQDLSPMHWRAIARRCRTGSFTIVGDLAQGIRGGGVASWDEIGELLGGTPEVCELTVNYRTPAEVMTAAEELLDRAGVPFQASHSVRSTAPPEVRVLREEVTLGDVRSALARLRDALPDGALAVIAPVDRVPELALDLPEDCVVIDVVEAKGLEFDGVVVVEPEHLAEASELRARRAYVAYTRTTTALVVLTTVAPV